MSTVCDARLATPRLSSRRRLAISPRVRAHRGGERRVAGCRVRGRRGATRRRLPDLKTHLHQRPHLDVGVCVCGGQSVRGGFVVRDGRYERSSMLVGESGPESAERAPRRRDRRHAEPQFNFVFVVVVSSSLSSSSSSSTSSASTSPSSSSSTPTSTSSSPPSSSSSSSE